MMDSKKKTRRTPVEIIISKIEYIKVLGFEITYTNADMSVSPPRKSMVLLKSKRDGEFLFDNFDEAYTYILTISKESKRSRENLYWEAYWADKYNDDNYE